MDQLRDYLSPRSPPSVGSAGDARAAAGGLVGAGRAGAEDLRVTERAVDLLKQVLDAKDAEERQCAATLQGLIGARDRLSRDLPALRRGVAHARRQREAEEARRDLTRAETRRAALQGDGPDREGGEG